MKTLKFVTAFLLFALSSCGQNTAIRKVDPKVTELSNKIIPLGSYIDNPDSCKKALFYLDSATKIDSNCFLCYRNKLMFLYSLKQFDKAVETINECLRINPSANDLYLTGGILYEKIGDTISSRKYFHKSLAILNSVLDTMNVQDMAYEMLLSNKAINLIMLDDNKAGNDLLKSIADKQQEPELKKITVSFINKTKKELVERMTSCQYSQL
jgi:tetratricopeptide (TPR) repeat protein